MNKIINNNQLILNWKKSSGVIKILRIQGKNSLSSPGDQEFDVGKSLSTSQRLDIGLFVAKKLYDAALDKYEDYYDDDDISGFLVAPDDDCAALANNVVYSQEIDTSNTTNEYMSTFFVTRDVGESGRTYYYVPEYCNKPFNAADATIYVNDLPTAKFQFPKINTLWKLPRNYHPHYHNVDSAAYSAIPTLVPTFVDDFYSDRLNINPKCRDYLARQKTTPTPPETAASLTTAAEFDREFGTDSSEQYTEPSPLLTQNMTIETTPETIRNIWSSVTAIVGYGCLALGAVGAVIYCLRRRKKQEVEDEENISAAKDGDGSPEIRQNSENEYAELSDFLLSRQDEENNSAAKDGDGSLKIMKKVRAPNCQIFCHHSTMLI